ncbi:hypothetical protein [Apilactobacillus micheneri]|uniref:Uncharacterized protein n=1 Tax=Apilactobacillus micheneri TaxID=1899430 RepID=A0A2S2JMN3_9LACO|nr:hypothetical protein [Apilactobacillus micheneri]TPR38751.1 hypothetical protein DY121_07040 [Apilactobacillus micheneri]TPR41643.1 hypothetical protein DY123_05940 [Apilactobacillus micheneri]TPR42790.1 hypothetical protein DY124_07230 [Apilactobacillus micheneri]TPR42854.1 hypothetical protein DY130_06965 [Apilactobacillus micheneri]TPR43630.1 hypothetical protein DY128_06965 [Apilactobacillus micheneri]
MKEKTLNLVMFIYSSYKGSELNFAKSLISHNFDETVESIENAMEESKKAFKKRLLEPIKMPSDSVSIDYSAAFEKMTVNKITNMELRKRARRWLIADEMLKKMKE